MLLRTSLYVVVFSLLVPGLSRADDDWEDAYEDWKDRMEDAREDQRDRAEDAREDWKDYMEDRREAERDYRERIRDRYDDDWDDDERYYGRGYTRFETRSGPGYREYTYRSGPSYGYDSYDYRDRGYTTRWDDRPSWRSDAYYNDGGRGYYRRQYSYPDSTETVPVYPPEQRYDSGYGPAQSDPWATRYDERRYSYRYEDDRYRSFEDAPTTYRYESRDYGPTYQYSDQNRFSRGYDYGTAYDDLEPRRYGTRYQTRVYIRGDFDDDDIEDFFDD